MVVDADPFVIIRAYLYVEAIYDAITTLLTSHEPTEQLSPMLIHVLSY
jgi:hypothetical protein